MRPVVSPGVTRGAGIVRFPAPLPGGDGWAGESEKQLLKFTSTSPTTHPLDRKRAAEGKGAVGVDALQAGQRLYREVPVTIRADMGRGQAVSARSHSRPPGRGRSLSFPPDYRPRNPVGSSCAKASLLVREFYPGNAPVVPGAPGQRHGRGSHKGGLSCVVGSGTGLRPGPQVVLTKKLVKRAGGGGVAAMRLRVVDSVSPVIRALGERCSAPGKRDAGTVPSAFA